MALIECCCIIAREVERRWKSDCDSESLDTNKEMLSVAAQPFRISTALQRCEQTINKGVT